MLLPVNSLPGARPFCARPPISLMNLRQKLYLWSWKVVPLVGAWVLSALATILIVVPNVGHNIPHWRIGYQVGVGAVMWLGTTAAVIVLTGIILTIRTVSVQRTTPQRALVISISVGVLAAIALLVFRIHSYVGHAGILPLIMWSTWLIFDARPTRPGSPSTLRIAAVIILFVLGVSIVITTVLRQIQTTSTWVVECRHFDQERSALAERLRLSTPEESALVWKSIRTRYVDNYEFTYLALNDAFNGDSRELPSDAYGGWIMAMGMQRLVERTRGGHFNPQSDLEDWNNWSEIAQTFEFKEIVQNSTTSNSVCD